MSGKSGCEYIKCEYVRRDTGGVRCTHPGGICIYRDEADTIATLKAEKAQKQLVIDDCKRNLKEQDATIARLTTENKRFRQERDDQFWARGHELKELIAARTALDEANRKYERAYDCHGQACGACIACCAEIIYDLTIRKDMAREDGYRQGWEHCKQVQDSFNEATIAVSRKFQEDLLEILTIVENDNDPDWSKVQKVKGIMLKHHIEEDEEMYDG